MLSCFFACLPVLGPRFPGIYINLETVCWVDVVAGCDLLCPGVREAWGACSAGHGQGAALLSTSKLQGVCVFRGHVSTARDAVASPCVQVTGSSSVLCS